MVIFSNTLCRNQQSWVWLTGYHYLLVARRVNHLSSCFFAAKFWEGDLYLWMIPCCFKKNLEDISYFLWGHWYPCSGLLVMPALGFKARVDPLALVLCHLCTMDSSDSPLVGHLLTSWQPEPFWSTYLHMYKHWWGSSLGLSMPLPNSMWHSTLLSFNVCKLSGGDTQRWWEHLNPTTCNQIYLNFLHSEVVETLKYLPWTHSHPQLPGETFTI